MMWKDSTDKINDKYISVGPDTFQNCHHAYKLPPFLIQPTQQCQQQATQCHRYKHCTDREHGSGERHRLKTPCFFLKHGVDVFLYGGSQLGWNGHWLRCLLSSGKGRHCRRGRGRPTDRATLL